MRNYIILNETNSNTINGLLIQKLPPISKPKIRTQVDEIDGRDGDVVTKLGYAAYDKTIEIGLHGNFDINEIIAFFNSEGTITFSNEPDKYYNYQILEQIDFEKLVRYRTAEVTIHVQPFKYLIGETTIDDIATTSEEIELTVNNQGNINSKPLITIYGQGEIAVSINSSQVFQIALGDEGYITIDIAQMEASKDGVLMNRLVSGNYDDFILNPGENILNVSGNVSEVILEKYSRWL